MSSSFEQTCCKTNYLSLGMCDLLKAVIETAPSASGINRQTRVLLRLSRGGRTLIISTMQRSKTPLQDKKYSWRTVWFLCRLQSFDHLHVAQKEKLQNYCRVFLFSFLKLKDDQVIHVLSELFDCWSHKNEPKKCQLCNFKNTCVLCGRITFPLLL